ncbi:sodium/pantothenate symporter [Anaerosphaera multitolerans]|uniref:Sodium/pantothenate symporter n=1 Tax=Anaerosphaera multitolerans TaxID=2487351 RepID=A0A437S7N6_9FIRM|nr:sodium/pantothenate symporter [Anaerosphaera multitolerans]
MILSVLILYIALNLVIGLKISKKSLNNTNFINSYFIGERSMGGLVLAMTLVATFISASSFIGGPGIAYSKGLSWVFLSMIQVPTAFIILAVLGKKFAIIARRTNSVTITDFIKHRYDSPLAIIILSLWIIIFSIAQMMAQFVGGAVLFQSVTGLPYIVGLIIFGFVVILYTSIGGFKAVVVTDTIQGIVMVIGSIIFLTTIISKGGGIENIVVKLNEVNPGWNTPDAGGEAPKAFIMSFWILVGIATIGLPQTAVRAMGFKDTKSLHNAMIYGTVVLGAIMLIMHISGVFAPAVLEPNEFQTTDYVVPTIVLKYLNPIVGGLFIAAPIAAVMSTVSSLLIMTSAAIVNDLYLNFSKTSKENITEKFLSKFSVLTTFSIGLIVFLLTITPPDLIVWINLFAMGGMECAFLSSIIFGLYWKRANSTGVILSSTLSPIIYILMKQYNISFYGLDAIVPSIIISIILFVVGSFLGKKTNEEKLKVFF